MFKQLSQIGKNLTDELAKGLADDISSTSSEQQIEDDKSGLPKEIQAKLRKFDKYEQKYPLLLSAYKNEKLKSEKFEAVGKILAENTPISNIDDAVDTLPAFFQDLNNKNSLLNEEIKRLTKQNSEVVPESVSGDTLRDKEEEFLKKEQDYKNEIDVLEKNINALNNESAILQKDKDITISDLREQVAALESQLKEERENRKRDDKEFFSKLKEDLAAKNHSLEDKQLKITELEERLTSNNAIMEEGSSKLTELNTTLKKKEEKLNDLENRLKEASNTMAFNQNAGNNNRRKKNRNKGKKNRGSTSVYDANKEETPDNVINFEEYEKIKGDLQALQEKYEDCEDWKQKYVEIEREIKNAKELENSQLEKSAKELENLNVKLTETKKSLKEKNSELEEVRDMLRVVGNELVDAKDEIKESTNKQFEEVKAVKLELDNLRHKNASMIEAYETKIIELKNKIDSLNKEAEHLKTSSAEKEEEHAVLQKKVVKLNEEISQLTSERSNLTKELTSLRVSYKQKDKTVGYLEEQVKQFSEQKDAAEKSTEQLQKENVKMSNKLDLLKKENETLHNDIAKNGNSYEMYLKENGKLSERLNILQEKYNTLQNVKSNSNEHIDTIKRQCEELNVKLKESTKKILSLEDELSEYTNIVQDKTREANTLRRLVSDSQVDDSGKQKELENKIAYLADEKSKLEAELNLQTSRKASELQEWKHNAAELKSEIHALKLREKELKSEVKALNLANSNIKRKTQATSDDSTQLEQITLNLKLALARADEKNSELQSTNENLMNLNNELNKKLDRLLKNYRSLSSQLSTLKERQHSDNSGGVSRCSSLSSSTNGNGNSLSANDSHPPTLAEIQSAGPLELNSEKNEKIAYIKNVLLGFLEHKEQRNQLLPVISMLLQLDSTDEKRLIMSLK